MVGRQKRMGRKEIQTINSRGGYSAEYGEGSGGFKTWDILSCRSQIIKGSKCHVNEFGL